MLCYYGLSLVFYLCQIHKMPCFVTVAFLWSLLMSSSKDAVLCYCGLSLVFIYVKFTRCRALLLWPFFGLLSMSSSQDAMFSYCGLSLVFYLCQVQKMLCSVIIAFLWSFIYVKFKRCCALLLWPFFGLLSMPSSKDAVLCYCGLSLVFFLCQVQKMLRFILWPFFGLLSMPSSKDAVLCYCGLSLVFYLCQVQKMLCFVIVAFLLSFINVKFKRCCAFLLCYFFYLLSMLNSQDAVLLIVAFL